MMIANGAKRQNKCLKGSLIPIKQSFAHIPDLIRKGEMK